MRIEFIATLYTYKECAGYMCIMSKIGCSKVSRQAVVVINLRK